MEPEKIQDPRDPKNAMKFLSYLGMLIVTIALALIAPFILGILVMILWNWLIPNTFGGPEIGYWHAVGLYFLSSILFKGDFNSLFKSVSGLGKKKEG